jgi:hypothetical protein
MTLIDTSVVIDYLSSGDPKLLGLFRSLPGGICGITRAEVLHGVRNAAERARIVTVLDAFAQIALPEEHWDRVGDLLATLRSKGVIVPFTDVVIASLAATLGIELWTRDKQFQMICQHESKLALFQEPP